MSEPLVVMEDPGATLVMFSGPNRTRGPTTLVPPTMLKAGATVATRENAGKSSPDPKVTKVSPLPLPSLVAPPARLFPPSTAYLASTQTPRCN